MKTTQHCAKLVLIGISFGLIFHPFLSAGQNNDAKRHQKVLDTLLSNLDDKGVRTTALAGIPLPPKGCVACAPKKGVIHVFAHESDAPVFASPSNKVIVTVGKAVSNSEFERVFLWVEASPILVHPDSRRTNVTRAEAVRIMSRSVTNWSNVTKEDGFIRYYLRDGAFPSRHLASVVAAYQPNSNQADGVPIMLATEATLVDKALVDKDCCVLTFRGADTRGLVPLRIDNVDPFLGNKAQPDAFRRLIGFGDSETRTRGDLPGGQKWKWISEDSAENPNRLNKVPGPKSDLYPLRQSVYIYVRKSNNGELGLDPESVNLAREWLKGIRQFLATPQ